LANESQTTSQSSLASSLSPPPLPPLRPEAEAAGAEAAEAAGYCVARDSVDLKPNSNFSNLEKLGARNNQQDKKVGNMYDSLDNVPCVYEMERDTKPGKEMSKC